MSQYQQVNHGKRPNGSSVCDQKVNWRESQKFSIGVTLSTVPPRLVKRILSGEFVDMGELSQDALRDKFKRGSEGDK